MSFSQFDFHPRLAANITASGYQTPTPIQREAMPPVAAGGDLIGLAQTGTGKTAAFALPILQRLLTGPRRRVRALVVAPTRELAEQIHETFERLGRGTGLRSVAIYGGVGKAPQLKKLAAGVEIVVACPGRLLDHLDGGAVRLSEVEVLVLDEADHMFDMGFLPPIRRILKQLPAKRQTLLFSATMPAEIRHLANEVLTEPATVQIDHAKPADTVSHALYAVEQNRKVALLKTILAEEEMESTLVFTRTKYRAKSLALKLEKAGFQAAAIQGNMSQQKRRQALEGFREGRYSILVATDIAARGIDVAGITHVINFDVPDTAEAYTHRIGRTGRATRTGAAFTFAGRDDRRMVQLIERLLGSRMEMRVTPDAVPEPVIADSLERPSSARQGRPAKSAKPARPAGDRQNQSRRYSSTRPAGRSGRGAGGGGKKRAPIFLASN